MLIALEGIDGSGKSTQLIRLTEALKSRLQSGHLVDSLKFPVYQNSPTGEILAALLSKGLKSKDSRLLFQSLMAVNRSEFLAALPYDPTSKSNLLLLDRYTLSGLVYGLAQGLGIEWLKSINAFLPEPDMTIYIDIPPDLSFTRRPVRRDAMEEDREFIQSTYNLYKQHLPFGSFIIDGTQSESRITEEILAKIFLVNDSLIYSF